MKKKEETILKENSPVTTIDQTTVMSTVDTKEIDKRLKSIFVELTKVDKSFIKVASCIYWIYETKAYTYLSYENIYVFAKDKFDISRGTCNGFLNIMERFGKRDGESVIEEIADKYKGFKSTQLLVMLGIPEDKLESVAPEMTVKEIKAFKKSLELPDKTVEEENGISTESPVESVIDVENKEVNRTVLLTVKDLEDYNRHIDKIDTLILNALNNKSHAFRIEISCSYDS